MTQTHLGGKLAKPNPRMCPAPRLTGVLINHQHRTAWPPEIDRPLSQRVLPGSGLGVAVHLPGRGLPDIHDSVALPVAIGDLALITHRAPARSSPPTAAPT